MFPLVRLALKAGAAHPEGFLNLVRALPPRMKARRKERIFRRVMQWAESRSPFYRRKFREHGIRVDRVRAPEDLGDFYVTPEELKATPEAFLCSKPDLAVESSGTTGHATRVFLSHEEMEYLGSQAVLLKAVYRISDDDRVLSTFDHGFCLDGLLASKGVPKWGSFSMCIGRVDPAEIYEKLPAYRFNIVMSGLPWLARFTEYAQAEGRPYPLKFLLGGGGGGIPRRTREWIEGFWEAPLCVTYASAEAATDLGFECLRRDGYHLNEFDFFVEILNPDAEGYGEVVITTLSRKVMPLIRYRTRDVARLVREDCPCGLPFRRLSALRGRLDEIVASVWGNVHPDFFEKVLGSIPAITDDWQVALQERNGKQTFEFRVEPRDESQEPETIRQQILNAVQREHPLAWQGYLQQLAAVDFTFHRKASLRTGRKLLRLVDERGMAERRSA